MDNKVSIIKLSEVIARTGLSRSSIYRKIKEHAFPSSVQLGYKAVGWVESEVCQWINEKIEERDRKLKE